MVKQAPVTDCSGFCGDSSAQNAPQVHRQQPLRTTRCVVDSSARQDCIGHNAMPPSVNMEHKPGRGSVCSMACWAPPWPQMPNQACLGGSGIPLDSPPEGQSLWDFASITPGSAWNCLFFLLHSTWSLDAEAGCISPSRRRQHMTGRVQPKPSGVTHDIETSKRIECTTMMGPSLASITWPNLRP